MIDLGAVFSKVALIFGAFVVGKGTNEFDLVLGVPLSSVTMLQAILKLSSVSQLAIDEELTFAVSAVLGPFALV